MKPVLSALLVVLSFAAFASAAQAQTWTVTKTAWTDQDEVDYSKFVAAIGDAKEKKLCISPLDCVLHAPGNIYKSADDAQIYLGKETDPDKVDIDCAYFPYLLRTYFAMKKGLPFSFIAKLIPVPDPSGQPLLQKDIRYSTFGNEPAARRDYASGSRPYNVALREIRDALSSGFYRIDPTYDSPTLPSDMYSVDIKKGSVDDIRGIRPGTNIYDPAGHVAVVYKIGKSGRIYYIDAHPGNVLTRGSYGMKFARSRPAAGAGFKNFRPIRVENGQLYVSSNRWIKDFSTTQYFGTNPVSGSWSKGSFILNGQKLIYYDYVRAVMANGNVAVDPINEMTEMMDGLCLDSQDRMDAVKSAIKDGISAKPAPLKLPYNIYGTIAEWEKYSSPSRDARLKTAFKELRDSIPKWLELQRQGSPHLIYKGSDLRSDLRATYNKMVASCRLAYTNSAGVKVPFTLNDVQDHLFDLSFSPYDCPEVRWGGIGGTPNSCWTDPSKANWWRATRKLRNQLERTYDVKMDYSAQELLSGPGASLGVETPPDIDVRKVL